MGGGGWGEVQKKIGYLELEAGETPEEKGIVWSWQLGKGLKKLEKGSDLSSPVTKVDGKPVDPKNDDYL